MKNRIGFNDKPIKRGLLYSDHSKEHIEAMVSHPDFDERIKAAQERMDRAYSRLIRDLDKTIQE